MPRPSVHRAVRAGTASGKPSAVLIETESNVESGAESGLLIRRVLNGVLHELAQPLTMLSFTEENLRILSGQTSRSIHKDLESLAAEVAAAANRYRETLDALSELVRSAPPRKLNLNTAVEECLRLISETLRSRKISVDVRLSTMLPVIVVDAAALKYFIVSLFLDISEVPTTIPAAKPAKAGATRVQKLAVRTEFRAKGSAIGIDLSLSCRISKAPPSREQQAMRRLNDRSAAALGVTVSRRADRTRDIITVHFPAILIAKPDAL